MTKRSRLAAWRLSIVSVFLVAAGCGNTSPREASPAQEPSTTPTEAIGYELAHSLGFNDPVDTQEALDGDCKYFAEVENGLGYCLDDVVSPGQDPYELMIRINGRIPTDSELEIHELQQEADRLSRTESDDPEVEQRLADIFARIDELRAESTGS